MRSPPTVLDVALKVGLMTRWMDGNALLRDLFATTPYRSLAQAVASLARFTHPSTVAQTGNQALFRVVRGSVATRGAILPGTTGPVMHDDNSSPAAAFLWAHGLRLKGARGCRDVQFNHLYGRSSRFADHSDVYTALANLCVTPSFLAKLTDGDEEVLALLRYRAFALYRGYAPTGERPSRPAGYNRLTWADPMPPVADLEGTLRAAMATKREHRAVRSSREIGWYFSGYRPDPSLPASRRLGAASPRPGVQ